MEDVEGLGVSTEHQGAANHVQAVDRQRLSGDQAGNGPIRSEIQMDISQSEASYVDISQSEARYRWI